MADRSRRARSSSHQRATPQPTVTRSTRSQSRDIADKPQGDPVKITRRGTRGASVESTSSVDSQGGRATRATRASKKAPKFSAGDLSTVDEGTDVPDPDLPAATVEQAFVEERGLALTPPILKSTTSYDAQQSPGAHSNVSGTTAISTAQTVHDPSDLDRLLVAEFLEDLYQDSTKVLDIVAPPKASLDGLKTLFSEVRKPGSRTGQRLDQRVDRLSSTRENFGDGEYISVGTVLASLAGEIPIDELSTAFRRPDAVLYKANLANMVRQMIYLEREKSDTSDVLIRMDNTFPRHFLSNLYEDEENKKEPASSALGDETFKVALEIRTQLAISLLSKSQDEPDFDPDATLGDVFFTDTEEGPQVRGWEIDGLGADGELPKVVQDTLLLRIKKIKESFPKDDESLQRGEYVDMEQLDSEFPWTDFIVLVLDWARTRNAELEEEIERDGGIDEISDAVLTVVDPSATPRPTKKALPAPQDVEQTASQTATTRPPQVVVGILKNRLARVSDTTPRPEPAIVTGEQGAQQPVEHDWQPTPLEDEEEDDSRTFVEQPSGEQPSQRSAENNQLIALMRERERQNKENLRTSSQNGPPPARKSFIDRQANAERVEFEDTQSPQPRRPTNATRKRQRTVEVSDDDDDDDDEFEVDERAPKVSERRKVAPVAKRARFADAAPPSSTRELSQDKRTPSVVPVSEDDDAEIRYPKASYFKAVTRQANMNAAEGRAKKRQPWTDEEIEALHEGVRQYGHMKQPWKMIKDQDDAGPQILINRDHVALKDKARNLCKRYDMARQARPEGFNGLSLGTFHQKQVNEHLANALEL